MVIRTLTLLHDQREGQIELENPGVIIGFDARSGPHFVIAYEADESLATTRMANYKILNQDEVSDVTGLTRVACDAGGHGVGARAHALYAD